MMDNSYSINSEKLTTCPSYSPAADIHSSVGILPNNNTLPSSILPPKITSKLRRRRCIGGFALPYICSSFFLLINILFAILDTKYNTSPGYNRPFPGRKCPIDGTGFPENPNTPISGWTLGGGEFTLTQVKFIDIGWDLVMGRGIQAVMAWAGWKIHVAALMHVMESESVAIPLYFSTVVNKGSVWELVKRIVRKKDYGPRMMYMLYSMTWLLVFPTVMSAMTGYYAVAKAVIQLPGSADIAFGDFTANGGAWAYKDIRIDHSTAVDHCVELMEGKYAYGMNGVVWIVMMVLQGIWLFGAYGLWADTLRKSELYQRGVRVNAFEAVTELGVLWKRVEGDAVSVGYDGEGRLQLRA